MVLRSIELQKPRSNSAAGSCENSPDLRSSDHSTTSQGVCTSLPLPLCTVLSSGNINTNLILKVAGHPGLPETEQDKVKTQVIRLLELPANKLCADCGADCPEWASTNLGKLLSLLPSFLFSLFVRS